MEDKEPKIVENTKKALLIRGSRSSQTMNDFLTNMHMMMSPHSILFSKKNDIHPFESEDEAKLEFLSQKNDVGLFALASSSKKRPDNVVFGRTFDGHILDMIEFGVTNFQSLESFRREQKDVGEEGEKEKSKSKRMGTKPCMLFMGDQWDFEEPYHRLQNLFIDFFRGKKVTKYCLAALDYVMAFVIENGKISVRHFLITLKKSGTKIPNVYLQPMGFSFDLTIRRQKLAAPDLWKMSLKTPKAAVIQKTKNVTENGVGDKMGRVHMIKQDLGVMNVKKMKALRDTRQGNKAITNKKRKAESEADDGESSGRGRGGKNGGGGGGDRRKKQKSRDF